MRSDPRTQGDVQDIRDPERPQMVERICSVLCSAALRTKSFI